MLRRVLALVLLGDGLITVVWGPGFLRWQRELAPGWYHSVLDRLLRWPDPLLRLGAAVEALVGWWLLTRWRESEPLGHLTTEARRTRK